MWTFAPAESYSAKLLISVPKKRVRHAVDRNFVKRRIREVFRLFEKEFCADFPCGEFRVAIIFLSNNHTQAKSNNDTLIKGLKKVFFKTAI